MSHKFSCDPYLVFYLCSTVVVNLLLFKLLVAARGHKLPSSLTVVVVVVVCFASCIVLAGCCAQSSTFISMILNWNVRGLNEGARRDAVQDLVRDTGCTIACLQETKLAVVDQPVIARTLGAKFINHYAALPASQTRGGILLAVSEDHFTLSNVYTSNNTITALITTKADGTEWWISVVYGPQSDADKLLFLQELRALASTIRERWLILGDFNLIYQAADKSNANLNRRLMGSFKATLDDLHLKEIRFNGQRFTWSNGQTTPTMTRIDTLFCTPS
ncbi:hypothetical protein BS78_07G125300 [Paspalum vaginatum]|nr:hypothetical protein BS78_07G125300 [Paspalum vaginatum]